MRRAKHTDSQIIEAIRQVDEGSISVSDMCFRMGVSTGSFYFWRKAYDRSSGELRLRGRQQARQDALEAPAARPLRRMGAAILSAIQEGEVVFDAQGLIRQFSAGAELLFGWRADEACGLPVGRIVRFYDASSRNLVEVDAAREEVGYVLFDQHGERRVVKVVRRNGPAQAGLGASTMLLLQVVA